MTTELHLTIKADSAADALAELAQIGFRAAKEMGVGPTPADTPEPPLEAPAKGNGADETPPATRRSRKRTTAEPDVATQTGFDRNTIIKGLTEIFMKSEPAIRDKITAFRDGHGVQRLRELKDDALPGAAKLLAELQDDSAP